MAKFRISAPDGSEYEVNAPEGATEEDAVRHLQGVLSKSQAAKPKINQQQYDEGWLANVGGLGLGVGDEFLAGVGSVFDPKRGTYEQQLGHIRKSQEMLAEHSPGSSIAGQVVGGLPLAIATGGGATALASRALPGAGAVAQSAAVGGAYGGAAGYGSGEGGVGNRLQSAGIGTAVGAGFGALFEGVISPAVSSFINRAKGQPGMITPQGQFTPQGARAAQEAGLDPNEASEALRREFAALAKNATSPTQAAAQAEARSLPVPLNLTRGQTSLDPAQQMLESQMQKGEFGAGAGQIVRDALADQQAGMRGNLSAIQARIGGGTARVEEAKQGVSAIQQRLADMQNAGRQNASRFYDVAQDVGASATISARNMRTAGQGAMQALRSEGHDAFSAPNTFRIIQDLSVRGGRTQMTVNDAFSTIRRLSALQKGMPTPDSNAAGIAKSRIQAWLDDAITNDLVQGDTAAVNAWRQANAGYRQYMQTFKAGDIVDKLVSRARDGSGALKLDVNGASNVLFGLSKTGFVSKTGMARDIVKIRDLLGPNSAEWRSLKEEAFMRFANSGMGQNTPTGQQFSGGNFMKAFEKAMQESPEVMRSLFSPEELGLISQFGRVARRITTPVEGGKNFSNTGAAITSAVKRLWLSSFMGPRLSAFIDMLPVKHLGGEMRAARAMAGELQRGVTPPPPLTGGARSVPLAVAGQAGGRR